MFLAGNTEILFSKWGGEGDKWQDLDKRPPWLLVCPVCGTKAPLFLPTHPAFAGHLAAPCPSSYPRGPLITVPVSLSHASSQGTPQDPTRTGPYPP